MTTFPLYESISADINCKKDLTVRQKEELMNHLKNINLIGGEFVYALIQYHKMISDESIKKKIVCAYSDNSDGTSDMTYNLSQFPIKLKQILYKYVLIHDESLQEDKKYRE